VTAPVTTPGRLTTVLLNQFDFTSQLDSLTRDSIVDQADVTTFGNNNHVRATHNLDAKADFGGFYDGSTASSFNTVVESLLGTVGVVTCSRAGNTIGVAADLISGIIGNDNVDAKEVGIETTKLTIAVTNPQPTTIDAPSMTFGKLLVPPTVVAVTTLVTGTDVTFVPVNGTKTNTQVVVHAHLLAASGSTVITLQSSPDGTTWTTVGALITSTTATSVRALFTTAIANTHFRVQYQGASQPYTLAVALALGASF
jgi:hypothetical protein